MTGPAAMGGSAPPPVCFVLPVFESYAADRGGALATVTERMARGLLDRGGRVTVLTRDDGRAMYPTGDVRALRYGSAHPLAAALGRLHALLAHRSGRALSGLNPYLRSMRRELRPLSADTTVIVHNDPEAAATCIRSGHQTVLWLHNFIEGPQGAQLRTLPAGVGLVAVSRPVAEWTAERYGIARARIGVVPNGVDLEAFAPVRATDAVHRPLRLLSHGRLDPNKGTDIVIEAVARARSMGVSVDLHLIGEVTTFGRSVADVEAFSAGLEAAMERVGAIRHGWVGHDAIAALLADADVACYLPRSEEPFCLAALEAMASGCAVIVCPTGGLADLVGDSAVTVAMDRPDEVAAAIARFATRPQTLVAARVAGRARAEAFSWDNSVQTFATYLLAAQKSSSGYRSSLVRFPQGRHAAAGSNDG